MAKVGNPISVGQWQQYLLNKLWRDPIRIFLGLTGCALFAWFCDQVIWTIPLVLGLVAAALTDLDDGLSGRLKNIFITLGCFILASVSVELLSPYPIFFAIGLVCSTCGFILLGALGQRYATIAFGALLLAIYTMLGIGLFDKWYLQPFFLLAGAIVYYLLTLLSHLLFPIRPVQAQLISTYQHLAKYLTSKAQLFDPDGGITDHPSLLSVASANSQLVNQLNSMKVALQSRLTGEQAALKQRRTLLYYFVAQEIHERGNSSHIEYHQIRKRPQFTELLFRLQRLMLLQANACQQVAHSIAAQQSYQHDTRFADNFRHIEQLTIRLQLELPTDPSLDALIWLVKNLKAIDDQLLSIASDQALDNYWQTSDILLSPEGLQGWRDIKQRLVSHSSPRSPLFRHAIRLSIVLLIGYTAIQYFDLHRGYWIMLTSLFVCQPNYYATRRRLYLRILGTLVGIAIGLPLLWLIPSTSGELLLIVISGVLFFVFRQIHYAHATLFITLMVLFCFDLLNEGFAIALPRIIYTLIGCCLAWIAVTWIFPDWRYRQLPQIFDKALSANYRYLAAVLQQYHDGKDNSVTYRMARREAHNADAEFNLVVNNSYRESWSSAEIQDAASRLLCLNHSLLSYISALGAHRQKIKRPELISLLEQLRHAVAKGFTEGQATANVVSEVQAIQQAIRKLKGISEPNETLLLQQAILLTKILPDIEHLRLVIAGAQSVT